MSALLAQTPTLQLFAPLLIAASLALTVLMLGRIMAMRKFTRAVSASSTWAPSIPTSGNSPLNLIDRRPRRRPPLSSEDSGATTLRFERIYLDAKDLEPS